MREACPLCALKHLSEAEALLIESRLGYPLNYWRALGMLAQAEAELVAKYQELAEMVRQERKKLELNPRHNLEYERLAAVVSAVTGYDVGPVLGEKS